jgi:hypothetical protein
MLLGLDEIFLAGVICMLIEGDRPEPDASGCHGHAPCEHLQVYTLQTKSKLTLCKWQCQLVAGEALGVYTTIITPSGSS